MAQKVRVHYADGSVKSYGGFSSDREAREFKAHVENRRGLNKNGQTSAQLYTPEKKRHRRNDGGGMGGFGGFEMPNLKMDF